MKAPKMFKMKKEIIGKASYNMAIMTIFIYNVFITQLGMRCLARKRCKLK